jgi:hypothetical protein
MAGVAEERGGHCALRRNDRGRRDGPHHCGLRVQYLQQRHLNRGGSRDINRRSYDRCPVLGCTTNVCAKGTTSRCSTARLNGSRCERSADAREKRPLALPHCCPSKSGNAMPQIEAPPAYSRRCDVRRVAQLGTACLLGCQRRLRPFGDQPPLFLRQSRVEMQHFRQSCGKLGPAIEGVTALSCLGLDVFGDDLETGSANRVTAARCASIPSPERCCRCVDTRK